MHHDGAAVVLMSCIIHCGPRLCPRAAAAGASRLRGGHQAGGGRCLGCLMHSNYPCTTTPNLIYRGAVACVDTAQAASLGAPRRAYHVPSLRASCVCSMCCRGAGIGRFGQGNQLCFTHVMHPRSNGHILSCGCRTATQCHPRPWPASVCKQQCSLPRWLACRRPTAAYAAVLVEVVAVRCTQPGGMACVQ